MPTGTRESSLSSDFAIALDQDEAAAKTFHSSSLSHRREYIKWIAEAKRDATRQKRISAALEMLAGGKPPDQKHAS